jgi:hypothetical protein
LVVSPDEEEIVMRVFRFAFATGALALAAAVTVWACDDGDDDGSATGTACDVASECFPGVVDGGLLGDPICLDRVEGGYCTHTCDTDADCCAAEGECPPDHQPQVCAPFESTGGMYCFLSCEGVEDGDAFCAEYAHRDFVCRSTGGGSDNRKVCVPNG